MSIYAEPMRVDSLGECLLYHAMNIPGHGDDFPWCWDLRENIAPYIGNFDFKNKRVLEIGPATGYITVEVERRGGDVVSIELPPDCTISRIPWVPWKR